MKSDDQKLQSSTADELIEKTPIKDALENIFVTVDQEDAPVDEYSDEEEAAFHAQYQEKHFV